MSAIDDRAFSYRITKDKKVFISWYGKQVTILKDEEAAWFIEGVEDADETEAQLLMARLTGNFKRGNEKHRRK